MEGRRGTLRSFDPATYTAEVQLVGSLDRWLAGVAVARHIPQSEMVPGRACALLFFDPGNPADAVLVAVWEP